MNASPGEPVPSLFKQRFPLLELPWIKKCCPQQILGLLVAGMIKPSLFSNDDTEERRFPDPLAFPGLLPVNQPLAEPEMVIVIGFQTRNEMSQTGEARA